MPEVYTPASCPAATVSVAPTAIFCVPAVNAPVVTRVAKVVEAPAKLPAVKKATAKKPLAKKVATKKPVAKKPAAKKSAAKKSAPAKKPGKKR